MSKNVECLNCGKRFKTREAAKQHVDMKHGGVAKVVKWAPPDDDDESMASRAIQAEIDLASGLGSDDEWLLP